MSCLCEGNRALRDLNHMRQLTQKAANLDGTDYYLYKERGYFQLCKVEDYKGDESRIVEIIHPE